MLIIGAKGLAKELLAVMQWNNVTEEIYLFDNINSDTPDVLYDRFNVLKSWDAMERHFKEKSPDFVLGIGGANARKFCAEKAISLGGKLCSLISKDALIGNLGVEINIGVQILSHAIITTDVKIGEGTLINKSAIISHDATIGYYCEISPGARILGRVSIGNETEIGTNAVILPDVTVGNNCKIGAGAVVTKNVPNGLTVVGIPAKKIRPK